MMNDHLHNTPSPPPVGLFERKGYHHGQLREALIAAAETLILAKGIANFSVSDAARMVGVSPAAPYRHFPDRGALLNEMARRGLEKLRQRLFNLGTSATIDDICGSFMRFASEEPAYYEALYGTGPTQALGEGIGAEGYDMLMAMLREQHGLGAADAAKAAVLIVGLGHGLASMNKPGPGLANMPDEPLSLYPIGVQLIVSGLAGGQKA